MSTFKNPSEPPKLLLVAPPTLPEEPLLPPNKLPDSWFSSSVWASFTLQSRNVKITAYVPHTPAASTSPDTLVEKISTDFIRHQERETSHFQCTCTTAARSKQTSAGSAASKETTSRRCASAGCSWCTCGHHQWSEDIRSQRKQIRPLNLCRHNLSFDLWTLAAPCNSFPIFKHHSVWIRIQ